MTVTVLYRLLTIRDGVTTERWFKTEAERTAYLAELDALERTYTGKVPRYTRSVAVARLPRA